MSKTPAYGQTAVSGVKTRKRTLRALSSELKLRRERQVLFLCSSKIDVLRDRSGRKIARDSSILAFEGSLISGY